MNCDCISRLETEMTALLKEKGSFKKPIKKVEMKGVVIRITEDQGLKSNTANTLEIELEGQKKKETISMLHDFCPFCGKKIRGAA